MRRFNLYMPEELRQYLETHVTATPLPSPDVTSASDGQGLAFHRAIAARLDRMRGELNGAGMRLGRRPM
jgi:hypothetical protein